MRDHGVDLRCGTRVDAIEGDGAGHASGVVLADEGGRVEAELIVIALGSVPNSDWLRDSGLAVGSRGIACDAACRAFDPFGIATDAVFVAGDVARFPHPLFNYEFMTLEHWGNAVEMAQVAAHNMIADPGDLRPHVYVPAFWSSQFDVSIKSIGVPAAADRVAITMGSIESGSFVASYGRQGRLVAMVGFDQGKWIAGGADLIRTGAPFPPTPGLDAAADVNPVDPGFATPAAGLTSYITLSGHSPGEMRPLSHPASNVKASS